MIGWRDSESGLRIGGFIYRRLVIILLFWVKYKGRK